MFTWSTLRAGDQCSVLLHRIAVPGVVLSVSGESARVQFLGGGILRVFTFQLRP